jgi:hypothetical protein
MPARIATANRHELTEAFLKRVPTVRNNVLSEVAWKIVEAAEETSELTVKRVLEIIHALKTREVFDSRTSTCAPPSL